MNNPKDIAQEVLSGNGRPLEAAVLLRRIIAECEAAYDSIKELAYTDFKNYGEKELTVSGATVKEYAGRTTYDYSGIAEHASQKQRLKEIEDRAKLAYRLISDGKVPVQDGCAIIDGELVRPCGATFTKPTITIKP